MDAQHLRQFAAGGNAVARAKVTGMNEGAKLIAKLNVEGNVAFGLKVYWQHCLSPRRYFSRNWTSGRANLSLRRSGGGDSEAQRQQEKMRI